MWIVVAITLFLIAYLSAEKRYRWFYILYKTLPRDFRAIVRFTKLHFVLWTWERKHSSVASLFTKLVKKHPNKIAFYFEDDVWTFKQLDEYSNQVANYFLSEGYKRGDTIALLLENRPEYVGIWMGLGKAGIITALINTNLTNDPLHHSLQAAKVKAIIHGSDYIAAINSISTKLDGIIMYQFGDCTSNTETDKRTANLNICLKNASTDAIDIKQIKSKDPLLFIYTSGTTGLPKAAVITNQRFYFMAAGLHFMTALKKDDILYNSLPLYHSAGGMVGVGQTLLRGIPVVLRKKFSASNFWKDCAKYNCTAAQYIGEICRYLLAVPETNYVKHNVRKMLGNGLKPQIWELFCKRFQVEEIFEFYGATEGNSNLINLDNRTGAVGFVPRYAEAFYPVTLIRCDLISGEPIRNTRGFCERCIPGEAGVFIGRIDPKRVLNQFTGYADKRATEKKVLEHVFRHGDIYFNSGDILVQDEFGYFYFRDRTGDTFRWKGENVATSEVEAVISNVLHLTDAVVYGVQIPGTDGRAGMAAIVDPNKNLDLSTLASGLRANLPAYALPLFIRVLNEMPLTGTFKLKKRPLQVESFDLDKINDALYFHDAKLRQYVPLTRVLYEEIMSGKLRL